MAEAKEREIIPVLHGGIVAETAGIANCRRGSAQPAALSNRPSIPAMYGD